MSVYGFAIKEVSGVFDVGTFTGNGSDNRDITAPGFEPGGVYVKRHDTNSGQIRTTAYSGDAASGINGSNNTNKIQSFISTGFQVGADSDVNENTREYHYWALKAAADTGAGGGGAVATHGTMLMMGV